MRKYSFSQRVINEWNTLSEGCGNASRLNIFKNKTDIYLTGEGGVGWGSNTYMKTLLDSL